MQSSNQHSDGSAKSRYGSKRKYLLLGTLALLAIVMPFLVWHETWFGRDLNDAEITRYLQDNGHPRRIQHALAQISARIGRNDSTVGQWYPKVVELTQHPAVKIRMTVAWVMGQDNRSDSFHVALLKLLEDSDLMVRRNAALSLVRFADPSGRTELRSVLQPYTVRSPHAGTISIELQDGQRIGSEALLARITSKQGQEMEIRSPFVSHVVQLMAQDGAQVAQGDEIVLLGPDSTQVWEALRGLYLIGGSEDLPEVEHYSQKTQNMPEQVRQQAVLTAQAIRTRLEQHPNR
jgi:hypothetical protein